MSSTFNIGREQWTVVLGGAALGAAASLVVKAATAAAKNDTRKRLAGDRGISVEASAAIQTSPEELYARWREFECLPMIFPTLVAVRQLGNGRSRWTIAGPNRRRLEWTAEIINEIPGRLIAWRTVGDADVVSAGSVHFTPLPGRRGTGVRVHLQYDPPGGKVASAFAWLAGKEPSQSLREGLRHFKQLIEAGEIPTSEPQPRGAQ